MIKTTSVLRQQVKNELSSSMKHCFYCFHGGNYIVLVFSPVGVVLLPALLTSRSKCE